jgi:hypothetical protein
MAPPATTPKRTVLPLSVAEIGHELHVPGIVIVPVMSDPDCCHWIVNVPLDALGVVCW